MKPIVNFLKNIVNTITSEENSSLMNDGVNIKDLLSEIHPSEIYFAWAMAFGAHIEMVITSGVDSEHTKGSVHPDRMAIDVRIWNCQWKGVDNQSALWWGRVEQCCEIFANILGDQYSVCLEHHHIHVQLTRRNILNPIYGQGVFKNFWITRKKRKTI